FSKEHYDSPIERMQFTSLVRDLKLYDHLKDLGAMAGNGTAKNTGITAYIENLVGRMFLDREIKRVLDGAFHKVLDDIDNRVRDENLEVALSFMEDFNRTPGSELQVTLKEYEEKTIFKEDKTEGEGLVGPWAGGNLFVEDPYSSYPVQNL